MDDSSAQDAIGDEIRAVAARAREAATELAPMSRGIKDGALLAMAEAVVAGTEEILAANARDVERARAEGTSEPMVDRLSLTADRVEAMAAGLRSVAALPDPIGDVVRGYTVANGLRIEQVRVPLGVLAIVYEARPNVTVDAAGLAVKSGNAVLLRGSASAHDTNVVLVDVLDAAGEKAGLPRDSVQLVPGTDRSSVGHLLRARGLVDVIIPRGGAGLISYVVENSTVPVIETGVGNCHVYVDATADEDMAAGIVLDAKVSRPSVCNAAETLLVHRDLADTFLPRIVSDLQAAGVTVHGDDGSAALPAVVAATDEDWAAEYGSLDMAVRLVDDVDDAIDHIRRWSTGHTEAVLARDSEVIRRFVARVDSAAVMVNASTRFTDGGEFGFGAEIGISTQKLHARGPMGLAELTSTKWIVTGSGHVRG